MSIILGFKDTQITSLEVPYQRFSPLVALDMISDLAPEIYRNITNKTMKDLRDQFKDNDQINIKYITEIIEGFALRGWAPISEKDGNASTLSQIEGTGEIVIVDDAIIVYTGDDDLESAEIIVQEIEGMMDRQIVLFRDDTEKHGYLRGYWKCRISLSSPLIKEFDSLDGRIRAIENIQSVIQRSLGWHVEPSLTRLIEGRSPAVTVPDLHSTDSALGVFPIRLKDAWTAAGWTTGQQSKIQVGVVDTGFFNGAEIGPDAMNVQGWTGIHEIDPYHHQIFPAINRPAYPSYYHQLSYYQKKHGEVCARLVGAPKDTTSPRREYTFGITPDIPLSLVEAPWGYRSDWQLSLALCVGAFGVNTSNFSVAPSDLLTCSIGDNRGDGWTPNRILLDTITSITGRDPSGNTVNNTAYLESQYWNVIHDDAFNIRKTRALFWAVENAGTDISLDQVVSHEGVTSVRGAIFNSQNNAIEAIAGAHGPQLDLLSPTGGDHYVWYNGDLKRVDASNSFATPIAAGVAALVLNTLPNLTRDQIAEVMLQCVEGNIDIPNGHSRGIVDAKKAIQVAAMM